MKAEIGIEITIGIEIEIPPHLVLIHSTSIPPAPELNLRQLFSILHRRFSATKKRIGTCDLNGCGLFISFLGGDEDAFRTEMLKENTL